MTCTPTDRVLITDTYSVETDGLIGFQVQVINAEGETYMTSPSLRIWSDAHGLINTGKMLPAEFNRVLSALSKPRGPKGAGRPKTPHPLRHMHDTRGGR